MNEILSEHEEWRDAVLFGNLHICDCCIHGKTTKMKWFQAVRRPFQLGERRLEKGVIEVMSMRKKKQEMLYALQTTRVQGLPASNPEEYYTHFEAAEIMRSAARHLGEVNTELLSQQQDTLQALLKDDCSDIVNKLSSGEALPPEERDFVFAVTRYILGKKGEISISENGDSISIPRHKRRKKKTTVAPTTAPTIEAPLLNLSI